jgi:polysaccharide export outer membrane protein
MRFIAPSSVVVTLALIGAPAFASSVAIDESRATGPGACAAEYVIGAEDVVDVAVWNNPDVSRTVPVRPDGKISLPLLNDVQASGFTPMQLRETLTTLLAAYISSPNVSVIVREIHSFKVTVIGEVKQPGRYELKGQATILDVLAMSGGFTEFAARDRVSVLRHDATGARQIPFTYSKVTEKPQPKSESKNDPPDGHQNFCVQPGDVILAP